MNKESNKQTNIELFRQMCLIREFENRAGEMYALGKIRGFLHLYTGEEAIAVGAISVLQPDDYVVTHYRDHGHALAKGVDVGAAMAELFGKKTGLSGGKGGSMHLFDVNRRFMGGHAIVGGHLPLAAGLALASKYKKGDSVVLAFLGDGAVNVGSFHETMNLAAIWKLPLVLFLENNLYGMGSSVKYVHARGGDFRASGVPYGINTTVVDGMDVLSVQEAASAAVNLARRGDGPAFIEAKTFRFHGHSMADPLNYRTGEEEKVWRKRDPLITFPQCLVELGLTTYDNIEDIRKQVKEQVSNAIKFADESPFPELEDLEKDVYA